ncbi:MAG: hypothetical protein HY909_20700, partial [Deltaproteobacteria bacterium]|nr:hypothetical protein [Deltaproteobacteria bacterium]
MTQLQRWWWSGALCAALLGCGDGGSAVPDAPAADTAADTPTPDTAPPDAGPDAALDAPRDAAMDALDTAPETAQDTATDTAEAPFRCGADGDCRGRPEGEVCDGTTGRCVPCLTTRDTCGAGRYCDGAAGRCADGCADDRGCAAAGADGGALPRRCDTPRHACVDCVTDEHCPPGTLCVGNVCVVGCTAARPCPTGQTCCAGACVDPLSNTAHCGRCDARCAVTNGVAACMNGACAVGMCTAPFGDCDMMAGNGCETNTASAVAHCGRCGAACPARANAASACAAGVCGYACEASFAECDRAAENGCEVDTRTAVAHCGACGRRCDPPNATAACADGACAVGRCAEGFGDCDRNASNGCEVDTRSAVAHCGACGTVCPSRPNALPGCAAGACAAVCVAGFAECNGDAADGCETALATSATHCGACGRSCAAPRASEVSCRASACSVVRCEAGYADCDGAHGNGCEVNLARDPSNCGACGRSAVAETCNGMDDDCDGLVDEDVEGLRANVPAREGAPATSALAVTASVTLNPDTGEITGLRGAGEGLVGGIGFRRVAQAGGPTLGVFDVTGVTVAEGVTVTVAGTAPLVVVSSGRCQIDGSVDANGADGAVGNAEGTPRPGGVGRAGGASGGDGSPDAADRATAGAGPGGGGRPVAAYHYGNGGGGAGFGAGG